MLLRNPDRGCIRKNREKPPGANQTEIDHDPIRRNPRCGSRARSHARPTLHQYHSHTRVGCGATGPFQTSRHADGGAYILADAADGKLAAILIGTGSEVALCIEAHEELRRGGVATRVVSMPSRELFEQQNEAYRDGVLPPDIKARLSVEMGSMIGWDRYVGATGMRLGMSSFGASAPLKELLVKFGFTPVRVVAAVKEQIAKHSEIAKHAGKTAL
jgi:pyruvate dehydrogenase complex dehydrogenase (E1) component